MDRRILFREKIDVILENKQADGTKQGMASPGKDKKNEGGKSAAISESVLDQMKFNRKNLNEEQKKIYNEILKIVALRS